MTPKEKLLESIERLISEMDEEKLKNVYQFVLHISKQHRYHAVPLFGGRLFFLHFFYKHIRHIGQHLPLVNG